jgi:signal recognition particle subunit SRP54
MSMLPMVMGGLGGMKLSDEMFQATSDKMKNYRVIMDSMTEEEMSDPKIIGGSRIKRISKGSGCSAEDVRELLKYHKTMQTAFKGFKGGKFNIQKMMKKKIGM